MPPPHPIFEEFFSFVTMPWNEKKTVYPKDVPFLFSPNYYIYLWFFIRPCLLKYSPLPWIRQLGTFVIFLYRETHLQTLLNISWFAPFSQSRFKWPRTFWKTLCRTSKTVTLSAFTSKWDFVSFLIFISKWSASHTLCFKSKIHLQCIDSKTLAIDGYFYGKFLWQKYMYIHMYI